MAPFCEGSNFARMTNVQFADDVLESLQERYPRFHGKAYLFLLTALRDVIESLEEPRHVSGEELALGVKALALRQYGPMARTVLAHWGIHSTQDLGEVVFAMVDCGLLIRREEDQQEDFLDLFDFEEAFERDYPWGARI